MSYLIDASNLGGVLGGAAGARDPEAVVKFLAGWARRRAHVVALFDGADNGRLATRYGSLEVAWSGAGVTADEAIVRRLRRARAGTTVVTADRDLARRCREAGARVMPPARLIERIAEPHPGPRAARGGEGAPKPEPSAADRAHWRKVFGGD